MPYSVMWAVSLEFWSSLGQPSSQPQALTTREQLCQWKDE
jgi:hypothetical protein